MCCKSIFCCPVCGKELFIKDKSYRCENGHCFDLAKSGYINLLTSDKMNATAPGDNKLMVNARSDFLNKGYYSALRDSLSVCIKKIAKDDNILLDAGCGEGYYTEGVVSALNDSGRKIKAAAIDISKFAAAKAAKRAYAETAVASVFHIPIKDGGCDMLMNVFAPLCLDEYSRVLRAGGYMILVIPGKQHLWELKKAVYDKPYENSPKNSFIEGYELIESVSTDNRIVLETNEDIKALFAMTPYFYKTSDRDRAKLDHLDTLEVQTEFEILCYKKGE